MFTLTANSKQMPTLKNGERPSIRYIYALYFRGLPFYVGDSNDPRERLYSIVYDARHKDRPTVEGVKILRQLLCEQDVNLEMRILEQIAVLPGEDPTKPTPASDVAEQKWIRDLKSQGYPISNVK